MGTVKTITIRVVTDAQAKDLAKVQSVLKGITKERSALIAKQADNIELTKKETERLTELTVKQVKNRETQKKLTQSTKNLINSNNAAVGSYDKLVAETAILRNRLRQLPNAFDKTNVAANRLKKQISGNTDKLKKFDKEIGQNFRNVGNYSGALKGAVAGFGKLAAGIGAGLIALRSLQRVFGSVASIVTDFQQGNARLASVLGKTREQITALSNDQKRLGASTAFTAAQVAELQTEFAKLGFNEKEILNATEATLALAAATGADLAQAAEVAGITVKSFGLDADQTQRVVDVMAKSFSSSALDINKFQEAMKVAAPAAKAVGVGLEETTALLAVLADRGISGSLAGTQLNRIFIELNKSGKTFQEALDEVTNSENKLGTAIDLVKDRGAKGLLIFAEQQESLKELEVGFNSAGGAAQRMADTQLDTLQGAVTILNSAFEGFILSIEDGDGAIANMARSSIELTTSFLSLITSTDKQSDAIIKQQTELNTLVFRITDTNLAEKDRLALIKQLNKEFPDFIGNIDAETLSNKQLVVRLKEVNDQLVNRIVIQRQQEKIDEVNAKVADLRLERFDREDKAIEILLEAQKDLRFEILEEGTINEKLFDGLKKIDAIRSSNLNTIQRQKTATNDLTFALGRVIDVDVELNKLQDETAQLIAERTKITDGLTFSIEKNSQAQGKNEEEAVENTQRRIDGIESIKATEVDASEDFKQIKVEENDFLLRLHQERQRTRDQARAEDLQKERENLQAFQAASSAAFSTIANFQQASLNRQLRAAEGNEEKQEEIRAKFGKKRKKAATIEAIINGAVAVTRILADVPKGDFGISTALLIAAAVVTTAGEVALIQSQEFAKGGLLTGSSHDQGGISVSVGGSRVVEAEGGEAIINKRSTQMFTPLLSAINEAGGGVAFGKGGKLPMMAQEGTIVPEFADPKALQLESLLGGTGLLLQNQEKLVEFTTAINDRIDRIEVINVATDTASVANTAANIESRATFG